MEQWDKIIIGAGLYGLYAALYAGQRGERVLVLEGEDAPFRRATFINQARVHMGYHYPRSYSTAVKSAGYFDRFNRDFGFCIHSTFDQTGNDDIPMNVQSHGTGQNVLHEIPSCRIAGLGIARVGFRILLLVLSTSVVQHTAVLLGNSSTLNKRGGISAKVQPDFACYIQYSRYQNLTHLLYFHSQL